MDPTTLKDIATDIDIDIDIDIDRHYSFPRSLLLYFFPEKKASLNFDDHFNL